jgi:hypothetical protein
MRRFGLFAQATGPDPFEETSIAEFALGTLGVPPETSH